MTPVHQKEYDQAGKDHHTARKDHSAPTKLILSNATGYKPIVILSQTYKNGNEEIKQVIEQANRMVSL